MESAPIQVWVVAAPDRHEALSTHLASIAQEAAALARTGPIQVLCAVGLPTSLPDAGDPADRLVIVDPGGTDGYAMHGLLAWLRLHAAEWPIVLLNDDDDTGLADFAVAFDSGAIDVIPRSVLDARVLARLARWTAATGRLRREERRVRALLQGYLETKSIGVVTIDRDGTILFANASLEQMFGYERGELGGRKIETIVPPAVRGRHEAHRANYWNHPETRPASRRLEVSGWRKDGSELAIDAALSHVRVGGEEWITALVSDVSERRAIERALSSSEAKLRAIVESGVQAIALMDPAGRVLSINRNMRQTVERLFGRQVESGQPLPALLPPEDRAAVEEGLHLAVRGETRIVELQLTSRGGEAQWFEITYAPVFDHDGGTSMVSMTMLSIDERKRASLALERSEQRLSAILRFSWDIIAIVDGDGAGLLRQSFGGARARPDGGRPDRPPAARPGSPRRPRAAAFPGRPDRRYRSSRGPRRGSFRTCRLPLGAARGRGQRPARRRRRRRRDREPARRLAAPGGGRGAAAVGAEALGQHPQLDARLHRMGRGRSNRRLEPGGGADLRLAMRGGAGPAGVLDRAGAEPAVGRAHFRGTRPVGRRQALGQGERHARRPDHHLRVVQLAASSTTRAASSPPCR